MLRRQHLSLLKLRLLPSQAIPMTLLYLRLQAVDRRFKKSNQTSLKGLLSHGKSSHQRGH